MAPIDILPEHFYSRRHDVSAAVGFLTRPPSSYSDDCLALVAPSAMLAHLAWVRRTRRWSWRRRNA